MLETVGVADYRWGRPLGTACDVRSVVVGGDIVGMTEQGFLNARTCTSRYMYMLLCRVTRAKHARLGGSCRSHVKHDLGIFPGWFPGVDFQ